MPKPHSLDDLISKKAIKFAKEMKAVAATADKEEEIRIAVEKQLAFIEKEAKIKRYDIAGRKVIFYIEDMQPGDSLSFSFGVKAMYPVKAKGTSSKAYSYYKPEIRGETLSSGINVN